MRWIFAAVLMACGLAAVGAELPSVTLEAGKYAQDTKGDLDAAIKAYQLIVTEAENNRAVVAEAEYRLGVCLLKQGEKDKGAAELQKVLDMYPDQKQFVALAKTELTKAGISKVPEIVSTTPAAFATDVDPSLGALTVTFDKEMSTGGWSWTGGGETFPKSAGKISYDASKKTCTMPVTLEPGKYYWVGINSVSHKNFKAKDGTPAEWYIILFTTKGPNGKPTAIPDDVMRKAKAINARHNIPKGAKEDAQEARAVAEKFMAAVAAGNVEQINGFLSEDFDDGLKSELPQMSKGMDLSDAKILSSMIEGPEARFAAGPVPVKATNQPFYFCLKLIRAEGEDRGWLVRDGEFRKDEKGAMDFVTGADKAAAKASLIENINKMQESMRKDMASDNATGAKKAEHDAALAASIQKLEEQKKAILNDTPNNK